MKTVDHAHKVLSNLVHALAHLLTHFLTLCMPNRLKIQPTSLKSN